MNEALKLKWLDALQSGEYRQAYSKLANGKGGYCCLGVLCEVAGIDSVACQLTYGDQIIYQFKAPGGSVVESTVDLPKFFYEKIGLRLSEIIKLTDMNDSQARPFNYIADWIDEHIDTDEHKEEIQ